MKAPREWIIYSREHNGFLRADCADRTKPDWYSPHVHEAALFTHAEALVQVRRANRSLHPDGGVNEFAFQAGALIAPNVEALRRSRRSSPPPSR